MLNNLPPSRITASALMSFLNVGRSKLPTSAPVYEWLSVSCRWQATPCSGSTRSSSTRCCSIFTADSWCAWRRAATRSRRPCTVGCRRTCRTSSFRSHLKGRACRTRRLPSESTRETQNEEEAAADDIKAQRRSCGQISAGNEIALRSLRMSYRERLVCTVDGRSHKRSLTRRIQSALRGCAPLCVSHTISSWS